MQVQRRSNGQTITLTVELGGGGEGKIYGLSQDSSQVAKVYHQPSAAAAHKLATMLAYPPEDPTIADGHVSIAWPMDLLLRRGQVVGFLMPRVDRVQPIHNFYNPKTRRDRCPFFNYLYLHRTARNLAAAVSSLHARGYVIGDVNESNILVTQTALVTLVDTDSFQVRDGSTRKVYHCPVGKPEFTPPELQGKAFRDLIRTAEQDRFGLAVLIFQLLLEGTHPFAGIYAGGGDPPPIEARIAAGHFPYGNRFSPYRATPVAPPLEVLHPQLRQLFVQCFEGGHRHPSARPDALTWVHALEAAEQELVICQVNPHHRYGHHLSRCPWCDRAQLLGGRDPFPSKEDIHRWRNQPPKPPQRKSPRTIGPQGLRTFTQTPSPVTSPATRPSFSSFNVSGFWGQVAQCKNDLLAGSLVLLLTLVGGVYWSFRSPETKANLRNRGVMDASAEAQSSRSLAPSTRAKLMLNLVGKHNEHNARVSAVAISSDGREFASSSEDGTIKIWSLPKGEVLRSLPSDLLESLAFSPDGQTLLGGTREAIETLLLKSGSLSEVTDLPFDLDVMATQSNNQTLLGGNLNGNLVLWNLTTWQPILTLFSTRDRAVAISADGQTLATVGKRIEVWNLQTGELRRTLKRSQGEIGAVALSPDGKILASSNNGENGTIELWEIETGNRLHQESVSSVSAIAFSLDGKILIAGEGDGSIGIWQLPISRDP